MKKTKENAITLVVLVITIIVLLILAGVSIQAINNTGLFANAKKAKEKSIQMEMKEQLILALNELQINKKGNAKLEDLTQDWINSAISSKYNPKIREYDSIDGKIVIMTQNGITGKFLINFDLDVQEINYNINCLEFEYETLERNENKIKILIKIKDEINGIKQIEYPDKNIEDLKFDNKKDMIEIEYEVELGKEYRFVIISGEGEQIEKKIKIDNYYYTVTKVLEDGASIDNDNIKVAYNESYEATILVEKKYKIKELNVTMGNQKITTNGENIVDENTGKIKILKVIDNIEIKVTTEKEKIVYLSTAKFGKERNDYNWTFTNSGYTESLLVGYQRKGAYGKSNEKFDFTDINKVDFNCNVLKCSRHGFVLTMRLISEENQVVVSSEETVWGQDSIKISLDTSNVKGWYYIGIMLECFGDKDSNYGCTGLQGNAIMTGE